MLQVFFEVVLPVALVAIVGGLVGRKLAFDVTTFSRAVFWLFSPTLVFRGISGVDRAGGEVVRVVAVAAAVFLVNIALAQAFTRARGDDDRAVAGATLASGLANQGNLGLPLSRLAFGAAGLELGTLIWVTNIVLTNSVGIAAASLGRGQIRSAMGAPFRFPAIYAAVAGIVVNATNVELPVALDESVGSLAGAAIPCMLIVLGLQFHLPSRGDLVDPVLVSINRLVVGPLVAWGVASAIGLAGVPWRESIMMAGMPTAVMVTIMAAQLDAKPATAVRTVVVSTMGSLVTLTILISLLR